jgi:hypothetical protein
VWIVGIALVVALGLFFGSLRQKVAVVAVLAITYALPIAIETRELPTFGVAWQGRYTLPLAVGVPVVAALAAGRRLVFFRRWFTRSAVALSLLALAVAQTGGFFWALGRAQTGAAQWPALLHGQWRPPGGPTIWILLFCACLVGLYALVGLGLSQPAVVDDTPPDASARALQDVEHEGSEEKLHA